MKPFLILITIRPQKKNLLRYSGLGLEGSRFDSACMYAAVTSFSSKLVQKIHFFLIFCLRTDYIVATYLQTACLDGGRLTFATVRVAPSQGFWSLTGQLFLNS